MHVDGTSVITKHAGTGGAVTVDTVTAQLLYEIGDARYAGPDVTSRFDTVRLTSDGPDRVRISDVRGEPPPPTLKVGINALGGFRNAVTFVLTGLEIEAKAALVKAQLADALAGLGRHLDARAHRLSRRRRAGGSLGAAALRGARQRPEATGPRVLERRDRARAGVLPGFPRQRSPGDASPYGVFTAGHVDASAVPHIAVLPDGARLDIAPANETLELADVERPGLPAFQYFGDVPAGAPRFG